MKIFLSFNAQPFVNAARRVQQDPSAPNYWSLRRRMEGLPPEHLRELVALMWLGRGFDEETAQDWPELLDRASGLSAEYLCEKGELGTYLDAGQDKIIEAVLLPQ
jgi:hypothetical protein